MKKYLFVFGIILALVGAGWFISTRSKQSDSASKVEITDKGINISQNGKNLKTQYITDTSILILGFLFTPTQNYCRVMMHLQMLILMGLRLQPQPIKPTTVGKKLSNTSRIRLDLMQLLPRESIIQRSIE